MPLVLASSGMMGRCPPAWGQPAVSTTQDVMGKVHMLEQVMTSHMELQRKQMENLSKEISVLRGPGAIPKVPAAIIPPGITVDLIDTPSKKRKIDEQREQLSYAGAAGAGGGMAGIPGMAVNGVQPLADSQQNSLRLLKQVFQNQQKNKEVSRSPRNICYGNAKTTGDQNVETMLAANVDLVASGVGKDCTNEALGDFLKGKGIDVVSVETLTKDEVLSQVRTKTFKITVKPSQYEAALKPEVWPYRVAVRHYRAPRRQDTTWNDQSGRTGGQIDRSDQGQRQRQPQSGYGQRNHPVGHPLHRSGQQQSKAQQSPAAVQLSNFFDLLGQLGSQEIAFN